MITLRAYPRLRGGTNDALAECGEAGGLSPPARGNPGGAERRVMTEGPIPACAGEPLVRGGGQRVHGAYPRLRGGTRATSCPGRLLSGLSPPARGNQDQLGNVLADGGPIPACAGEPPSTARAWYGRRAYPRLRGGTSAAVEPMSAERGLSPPARGNPGERLLHDHLRGPIPACAGEPT